jgi:type I restriction enzyme R subunit
VDLNEAQTRAQRIDQQLSEAGWGDGAEQIDFETEFEVRGYGTATQGFVDYVLRGPDGKPIAIVEAKRASRDAIVGKEQGRLYADAIQASIGRRPFIFLANGDEIWFWDTGTEARLVAGFATRDDLERRLFQREHRTSTAPTSS